MAAIFQTITSIPQEYDKLMKRADPRLDGFPLMSTPWPSLILTVLYVYFVKYSGPKFMENRKPYDLRNILLVYNFAMVALSAYIFLEFGLSGWFVGYSYGCQPVDYSRSAQAIRMVNVCWLFYISKFIEMLDTVFFVLRKKNNQVSFLHVFHHGIMPLSWWVGVKFVAGGFGTFHALLNSFIHFLMYTYYGLAALGPAWQKFLWWKKYMTTFQITQFMMVTIHSVQLLFFKNCNYPKLFVYWILAYAMIFLVMFADFYVKAYTKPKKGEKSKGKAENNNGEIQSNGYKAAANGVKSD